MERRFNPYLVAIVLTAVAAAVRWVLDVGLGLTSHSYLILVVGASFAAAWYGGFRAGLLPIVVGIPMFLLLFMNPRYTLQLHRGEDWVLIVICGAVALCGCWLCENLHLARRQVDAAIQRQLAADADRHDVDERYRLAAEAVNGIIYEYEFATGHVERSRGLYEVLGYHAHEVPPTVQWWMQQCHPDDWALGEQRAREIKNGKVPDATYRVRHKDGRWLYVHDRAVLLRDETGQPVRMVGCSIDITAGKLAEQQLRESESFARHVSDVAPSVLYIYDLVQQRNVWGNRETFEGLGYSREQLDEFGGNLLGQLMHPDDFVRYADHAAELIRLADGDAAEFEYRLRSADGSWRWLVSKDMVFRRDDQGRVTQIIGAGLDITARKEAEDQLRQVQQRLQLALETSGTGIWEWDATTDKVIWTDECYAIHGVDRDCFHGTAEHFDQWIHPDDRDRLWTAFRQAVDNRSRFHCEFRIVRADGSVRWVENTAIAVLQPDQSLRMIGTIRDVTDRVEAIDQIRHNAQRLSLAVEVAGMGINQIDYLSDTVVLDETAAGLFGLQPHVPLSRAAIHATFHDDDRPEIMRRMTQSLDPDGDGGFAMDHRVVRPDGTIRWLSVQKQVTFAEIDGVRRPVKGILAGIDVTERKQAEEEVRAGGRRFQAVFDHQYQFSGLLTPDGRVVEISRSALQNGNFGRDELIGLPFLELPWFKELPDSQATWRSQMHEALQSGRVMSQAEIPYHTPDGSTRWSMNTVSAIRDDLGRLEYLLVEGIDITDRKQAENQSRLLTKAAGVLLANDDPNAMLRGIFDMIAPSFGLDAYFNFMTDGPQTLRLMSYAGVTPEDCRPMQSLPFGQAVCGNVAQTRQPICVSHIQRSDESHVQLIRSLGLRVYACNPLLAGGELMGTLSFASRSRDEFTADELDFLRTISQYVAAAYDRLRLLAGLREADRKKDQFLATLAHELRNPLAPIKNAVQLMAMTKLDDDTEELRQTMARQVEQLVRLIDDLLDVSRISRGKITLRKSMVSLKSIIDGAVEASAAFIGEGGQELHVDHGDCELHVYGDPARLAQVFSNLLNNASKYSAAGCRIDLRIAAEGDQALIEIRDNGIGIDPDQLQGIFQLFSQLDTSLERGSAGLGIGLNLVKTLVELHGGSVRADSRGRGQGSVFTVTLPVVTPAESELAIPTPRAAVTPPPRSFKVLVVEDQRALRIVLSRLLEKMGHQVRGAHDGQTALEMVRQDPPDIVFSDISMPGMTGYDLVKRLRELPELKDTHFVAMTGYGQSSDRQMAIESGFDEHLVKPVDVQRLHDLFQQMSGTLLSGPATTG